MPRRLVPVFLVAAATVLAFTVSTLYSSQPGAEAMRNAANKQFEAGNYKEAYDSFRPLLIDPQGDPRYAAADLQSAVQCLASLGRLTEFDSFIEEVIEAREGQWQVLVAAARQYQQVNHSGVMIAGEFRRADRSRGKRVDADLRDRTRSLQLLQQAMPLVDEQAGENETGEFYLQFAQTVFALNRPGSWLHALTDLETLPDYEEMRHWYGGSQGAAVDEEGNPIFVQLPASYEAATSDGQRWRWLLNQASQVSDKFDGRAEYEFASYLYNQFSVQTLRQFGGYFPRGISQDADDDGEEQDESGTYALHTLTDDETIARLAVGIRRFELPAEFNYIRIFERLATEPKLGFASTAIDRLAGIYENRRQYSRAAEVWRRAIEEQGPQKEYRQQRLDQIVGNWGRFEPMGSQPAGRGATVNYRFRNGTRVEFTAQQIDIAQLLSDVKAYLKSNPKQLQWEEINVDRIGYRLLEKDQQKYIGRQIAVWSQDLKPRAGHVDDRITVTTPLENGGAYWLTAKMADGNVSHMVLWVDDMILVRKNGSAQGMYYLADSVSGEPISGANVEFFGYRQQSQDRKAWIDTKNFAEKTDADGLAYAAMKRLEDNNFTWLTIARASGERLAFLGFNRMWFGRYQYPRLDEAKVYTVTDRPIYRPGQTVFFKTWLRTVSYDTTVDENLANQNVAIEVRNPTGDVIHTVQLKTDSYGAVSGEFELPSSAKLGQFNFLVNGRHVSHFRVEEYKKPEYEVTVTAPEKPVALGDTFTAKIEARYYFGSPVTEATVRYKVTRSNFSDRWYPVGPWDWLYGRGYGAFGGKYSWYPGWSTWGCVGPRPWWDFHRSAAPELVAEQEVAIGADGTVTVEVDTATAKELHGDEDHRYEITVEVVDQSRRTVVGAGSVLAARRPFTVTTWTDRGYYNVGQAIEARFSARTLDGRPVPGKAEVTLLSITYDKNRQPVETPVRTWELAADDDGGGLQRIQASAPGQYRVSVKVTDDQGNTIEGGHVFIIRGEGFDGRDFRFNNLELVLDRREYTVDEKVQLLVNTDRPGSTVLLYVRPASGVYPKPKLLRLEGKSTVVPLELSWKDMPNFFVEAVTISDGNVYTEVQEILVPPISRVANVEVLPSAEEYLPGEQGTIRLKFTDDEGNPFVGSTVLSVYDKALDAIAGGSNVPDIKEFFWKWRRSHQPNTVDSTVRYVQNLVPPGQIGMNNIGIFGDTVVEEMPGASDFAGGGAGALGVEAGANVQLRGKAAMPAPEASADGAAFEQVFGKPTSGETALVEPTVRSDFADSALWAGAVNVNEDGTAEVEITMPENLTAWLVKVWTVGGGTRVGQGEAQVVTRKNLIVRLQAPRFFVERDEVVLSANVHNYLESDKEVQVSLELDGPQLTALEDSVRHVTIPAGGEVRVDWRVKAAVEGEAVIRMLARSDEESDAVQQRFPVYVHGMLRTESVAGALRPDETDASFTIEIPSERRPEQSRLEIRYSPTLAGAMVDALPYLANYPYGCTEQTLSRFLPTVITQRILLEMDLDLEAIRQKQTNLNAQEIGDDRERAKGRVPRNQELSPVFDEAVVREMVTKGIDRLTEMQLSDGGWGWFSGWGERSYPHTTAYVVHGLQIAKQNDVALVPGMLEQGIAWLQAYQEQQVELIQNALLKDKKDRRSKSHADNTDAFVYMVLADADVASEPMRKFLYRDRTKLSVYAKCMFALAMHKQQRQEELNMLLRNISQFLVEDKENQTAYLQLPEDNFWWNWYGSGTEANAYYLKLLAKTDPKGRVASRLAKYVVNNRRNGNYWNSTRDTALSIEALAEFMRASGEDSPEMTVEVWVDGTRMKTVEITKANLFNFDNRVVLVGDELTAGPHKVELRKQGTGPLYFNAYTTNFTLEDNIEAAGLEIKVQRSFYRLVEVEATAQAEGSRGQPLEQRVQKYRREPLLDLSSVVSGQLIEIELVIDSKNDYEYLIFEDFKAAGFEPVENRSGYNGNDLGAYVEFRDERVAFFVSRLTRGQHSVRYRLRAEVPGKFSALPAQGTAMYAPELRANSDEIKLNVEDALTGSLSGEAD